MIETTPRLRSDEAGAALLSALLVTVLLAGASMSYLSLSVGNFQLARSGVESNAARLAAEDGIHLAIAELKSGNDADGDGLGSVQRSTADGRVIRIAATSLGSGRYRLHSRGVSNGSHQGLHVVVEILPPNLRAIGLNAAVSARAEVDIRGNTVVDGRDYNLSGSTVTGPGVTGISSMDQILTDGSSTVGGLGSAPSSPPAPGTTHAFDGWSDGIDNDGDGVRDEETLDGVDNDGDLLVDEDTRGYPTGPDALFGLPQGTLKHLAQAAGTYFHSETALTTYQLLHGGSFPGGSIIYADFDTWQPCELGLALKSTPSIIVHHNPTGTAMMKNVHGLFCGLILADEIDHLNGSVLVVGGIVSFAEQVLGNTFGNGNARIAYSSAVLGNLPGTGGRVRARILSWNRAAAYEAP